MSRAEPQLLQESTSYYKVVCTFWSGAPNRSKSQSGSPPEHDRGSLVYKYTSFFYLQSSSAAKLKKWKEVQPECKRLSQAKYSNCKKNERRELSILCRRSVKDCGFFLLSSHPTSSSPAAAVSRRKTRVFKETQFTLSPAGNKVRERRGKRLTGISNQRREGGRRGEEDGWIRICRGGGVAKRGGKLRGSWREGCEKHYELEGSPVIKNRQKNT